MNKLKIYASTILELFSNKKNILKERHREMEREREKESPI